MSETSGQLATEVRTLANNYRSWKTEAAAHRKDMASLSEALRQGDARMAESVSRNAKAQLEVSSKTLGNVENFRKENDRLLERMGAAGEEFLDALRQESGRIRRWTVPALAAALVLAVPAFAAVGAYAQSEFRIFRPYDDTKGWKQGVWERHGEQVKACMLESRRENKAVRCSFDVEYF